MDKPSRILAGPRSPSLAVGGSICGIFDCSESGKTIQTTVLLGITERLRQSHGIAFSAKMKLLEICLRMASEDRLDGG